MTGPELSYELSQAQLDFFDQQGYLHIPYEQHRLFDKDQVNAWSYEVKAWPLVKGKWMPYNEVDTLGHLVLLRTEHFADYHDGFDKLFRDGRFTSLLSQIRQKPMYLFKDKVNYKNPHANGFQPHLDKPAYEHISNVEHLTINIAVDPATVANGCLEVVPGSHKMDVPLTGAQPRPEASWVAEQNWVHVPLGQGDLLIFGSKLAHRSGPNNTEGPRASIYATYSTEDKYVEYYAHRRAFLPPEHEKVEGVDYSEGLRRYAGNGYHFDGYKS